MNKDVIDFKVFEYLGRAGTAAMRGGLPKARRDAATLLILCLLYTSDAADD